MKPLLRLLALVTLFSTIQLSWSLYATPLEHRSGKDLAAIELQDQKTTVPEHLLVDMKAFVERVHALPEGSPSALHRHPQCSVSG